MKAPQTWQQWIRACARDAGSPADLPPNALAALTSQDTRALGAIAECWALYACSDDDGQSGALAAVRALLPAILPHNRYLARELIAFTLDWPDRDALWPRVCASAGDDRECPRWNP